MEFKTSRSRWVAVIAAVVLSIALALTWWVWMISREGPSNVDYADFTSTAESVRDVSSSFGESDPASQLFIIRDAVEASTLIGERVQLLDRGVLYVTISRGEFRSGETTSSYLVAVFAPRAGDPVPVLLIVRQREHPFGLASSGQQPITLIP